MRLRAMREELGQSLVELALLLPILVFCLIGGADLARAFALQLAIQNGARAGAEAYAIDANPTPDEAISRAEDEMARTPGFKLLDPSLTVDVVTSTGDGVTDCTVTPPTPSNPCFVTVSVHYVFKTIIPWPIIPNTATFDRSTTMRLFY